MRSEWLAMVACGVAVMAALTDPAMAQYSGGSGTPNDPWQIADPNDLIAMGQNTQHYGDHFILTGDIDMAGAGPGPNGSFSTALIAMDTTPNDDVFNGISFIGAFDGQGHVIRNLVIDGTGAGNDGLGLFGNISNAQISSLGLEHCLVSGDDFVGGLVGGNDFSTLTSCYASGEVTGGDFVGGLAGCNWCGTVTACYARTEVTGDKYIGGLVGDNYRGSITASYATGAVTGNVLVVGGLVGRSTETTLTACYATGAVTGTHTISDTTYYLGGLIGESDRATLTACHATGAVTAHAFVGGLVGYGYLGTLTACYATGAVTGDTLVGGLVGVSEGITLTAGYATGAVTGSTYAGGLTGYNDVETITTCYFLDTAGPDNGYGTPLSDSAMRQQASFVGFDFWGPGDGNLNIWLIDEGVSNPYFAPAVAFNDPTAEGTLVKSRGNAITLTFSTPIALTGAAPLSIVPIAGGADVAGQFTYSVNDDGVTLTAVENGAILTNQTWYRITPTPAIVVANFVLDLCTLIGDADGNGQVLAGDLGRIWSHNAEMTDGRCDINGDGQVLAADLGMAWSHNAEAVPAKP